MIPEKYFNYVDNVWRVRIVILAIAISFITYTIHLLQQGYMPTRHGGRLRDGDFLYFAGILLYIYLCIVLLWYGTLGTRKKNK